MAFYDWAYGHRFAVCPHTTMFTNNKELTYQKPEVISAETGLRYYPDSSIKRIEKVTTSVLASLIPGIIALGLYFRDTTVKRIGTMLACTAIFAFVLSFWTQANVVDVFATTGA